MDAAGQPRRSPCTPARSTSRSRLGGETLVVAAALAEHVRCAAARLGAAAPAARRCRAHALGGARVPPPVDRPRRQGRRGRLRGDGRRHRARAHRARPRRGGLRARPRRSGCAIYNPVDDDGRFVAEVAHFAGPDRLGGEPRIVAHLARARRARGRGAAHAHLPALLALQEPDAVPGDRAVVHRARQAHGAAASAALDAIRHDGASGSRRGARSASTTWSRTAPTGPSRASACGACRSSRSTARAAAALLLEERDRRARGRHLRRRARAPTSGTSRAAAELLPAGTRCAKCGGERRSARRPTSSTCGSTRAAATRRCWRRGPSCAGRPRCTSRARTSTAAGSTPRCWRRWARAGAPPYRAVLTHGFVVDGEGRKMSKSVGNTVAPDELIAEVRRRGPAAVGRRPRTTPRTSGSPARSSTGSPTRTGASATPAASCSATWPTSTRRATGSPTSALDEARSAGRCSTAWRRLIERVRERLRGVRVPHRLPQPSTTSARWISRRSTSTSSRTGSTPRRANDPRRRAAQTVCYEILDALARLMAPILTFTAEEVWRPPAAAPAGGERAPRATSPRCAASGSTTGSSASGSACSRCGARSRRRSSRPARRKLIGSGLEAPCASRRAPEDLPGPAAAKRERCCATLFIVSRRGSRRARRRPGSRRAPPCATRARRSPASVVGAAARRARSASAAGRGARPSGGDAAHPALCERCVPVIRAGAA